MKSKLFRTVLLVFLALIIALGGSLFYILRDTTSISAKSNFLSINVVKAKYQDLISVTVTKIKDNNYDLIYNGTSKQAKAHIGNPSSTKFVPQMTFGAWEECQIVLTLDSNITGNIANSIVENADGSLEVGNNNFNFKYKPVEYNEGFNDEGGLDFWLTLKKKPGTNVLPFTYNSTLVKAYFQGELTAEEIAEGCIRPDYVVNSIAFYHETKGGMNLVGGKDYKAGKIGHLYRLKVTDSSATPKTTWANWSLSGSNINLTVDQTFLNTATYPVTIAPVGDTFGFEGIGGTSAATASIRRCLFTCPSAGTATNISYYSRGNGGTVTGGSAIYNDNAGTPSSKLAEDSGNVSITTTAAWYDTSISASLSAANYWLSKWGGSSYYYYDAGTTAQMHSDTTGTWETWPDPAVVSTSYDRKMSIHCDYTAGASYDITNDPSTKAFGILADSTAYYAKGSAPNNPVEDGDCTYILTSTGSGACDIDIKIADFTGGNGWNIVSTSPSTAEARVTAYYTGQNPASGLILTNNDQEFYDNLASSGHFHWDFKLETGLANDGAEKTTTMTLTSRAHS